MLRLIPGTSVRPPQRRNKLCRFAHALVLHRLAARYISVNWDVEELVAKKDAIVQGDLLKVRLRL
jgi:hypothetical protein